MKKNLLKIGLCVALVLSTAMFYSCGNDPYENGNGNGNGNGEKPDPDITTAEARANIQASFDRVQTLMENFREGLFFGVLEEFLGAGPQDDIWYYRVYWPGEWGTPGNFTRVEGMNLDPRGGYNRVRSGNRFGWNYHALEVNSGDYTLHNEMVVQPTPGHGEWSRLSGRNIWTMRRDVYGNWVENPEFGTNWWWELVEIPGTDYTQHHEFWVHTPGQGTHNRVWIEEWWGSFWDYQFVGYGGDYTLYHNFFEFTPGQGHTNLFRWTGSGNYMVHWVWWQFTPGQGDHNLFEWVGRGNGTYAYSIRWEHTPGRGTHNRQEYGTYFGFAVPEFTLLLGDQLAEIVDFNDVADNNRFRMATFAGTYTWNNTANRFDRARDRNDIRVTFPIRDNSAINGVFAITQYQDQQVHIHGNDVWLPTRIQAHFDRGNERISSVDATARFTQFGIPIEASVELFAKPITLTSTLSQETPRRYAATLEVRDATNSNHTLSIEGTAAVSQDIVSYTDLSDVEIENLIFTLRQYRLRVEGTVNFRALNAIRNPSVQDINNNLTMQVFWGTNPDAIGSLRVQEVRDRRYLYIVYRDGTRENTNIFYDSFLEDIENMFMRR